MSHVNLFSFIELDVRQIIFEMESENIRLKTENSSVIATLNQERERMKAYESKIIRIESTMDSLNRKVRDREEYIQKMERDLGEKQVMLNKKELEKEKQRRKFTSKMAHEKDHMKDELELKLSEQKRKMQEQMRNKEEKLRLVTNIVNSESNDAVSGLIDRFNNNENKPAAVETPVSRSRVSVIRNCM